MDTCHFAFPISGLDHSLQEVIGTLSGFAVNHTFILFLFLYPFPCPLQQTITIVAMISNSFHQVVSPSVCQNVTSCDTDPHQAW